MSEVNNRKGIIWSIVSLVLSYVLPVVSYIILLIMVALDLSDEMILICSILACVVSGLGMIFGFAIMIVVRIHSPKCVLGKIVMWIDIVFLALVLIALGIFAIYCLWSLKDF